VVGDVVGFLGVGIADALWNSEVNAEVAREI
jgi:hypothetical protein